MFLFGLTSLLLTCWSGQADRNRPADDSVLRTRREIARTAQVHCSVRSGCPEGVALWTALEPRDLPSQCTSFLIAPDLAVANHHCLPAPIRKAGADCRGQVWLHFPALEHRSADSVSCREVVALSPTSERIDQPDWALVRLVRPLSRQPLPLARNGVRDLDSVVSWVCNPDWGLLVLRQRLSAELRPLSCRASRRTETFRDPGSVAEFSDSLSRRVPLASCPAQKGNSGAPVLRLDPDGVWRVHALLDRAAPVNGVRDWARRQGVSLLDSALGEFAWATNLACIPLPGFPDIPTTCRRDSNHASIELQREALRTEIDTAIAAKVAALGAPIALRGKILQRGAWTGFPKGLAHPETNPEALIVPLPACASPGLSDSLLTMPVWSMRFGYDRDLRWSFRMDLDRPSLAVSSRCRPLGASNNSGVDICQFQAQFPETGTLALSTDTLGRCFVPRAGGAGNRSIF